MVPVNDVYDVVGIGFGPANIALAIALKESGLFPNTVFLERSLRPVWQEEMLFDISLDTYSNIQNVPYRDLITPCNPRSRYTFLNYLFESGLMFEHLNMDMLLPLRPDYARYIAWVVSQFSDQVITGQDVVRIHFDASTDGSPAFKLESTNGRSIHAHNVVIGTGRPPYIPAEFMSKKTPRIFHQSRYNSCRHIVSNGARRVAVVGSSQSAVEIILHLSKINPSIEIHALIRRFGFPLKDTNPFMSEIFFPEFTDMYFGAREIVRRRIDRDVKRTNYGACDMDVLEELYRQIYYDKLHDRLSIFVRKLIDIKHVEVNTSKVGLTLLDNTTGAVSTEAFDAVILATGFANIGSGERDLPSLPILEGLSPILDLSKNGCVQVDRGYRVKLSEQVRSCSANLILNGLCENTHGMGDGGSLSLVSFRAKKILETLQEARQETHAT